MKFIGVPGKVIEEIGPITEIDKGFFGGVERLYVLWVENNGKNQVILYRITRALLGASCTWTTIPLESLPRLCEAVDKMRERYDSLAI
ncbi:MAG: hypothetical protein IH944_03650 [Armatimonadetes bacterium]|nr:hypothetical protein [Armatimonadota bacterium]